MYSVYTAVYSMSLMTAQKPRHLHTTTFTDRNGHIRTLGMQPLNCFTVNCALKRQGFVTVKAQRQMFLLTLAKRNIMMHCFSLNNGCIRRTINNQKQENKHCTISYLMLKKKHVINSGA